MSQSFSNNHFTNLPDNIADIVTGILERTTEFYKRLKPVAGQNRGNQSAFSMPANVLFYVPTIHMDDTQYQGHGFLPHLAKKSFLDIDVGFVPVRQVVTVRHAKMSSHFTFEDAHIDLFNRVHHPDYLIGGYDINGNRLRGVTIPLPDIKTAKVFVRVDEHWQMATEHNGYVTAAFHRYFLVDGVALDRPAIPKIATINSDLLMLSPEWRQQLVETLNRTAGTLANPQYYEHLGMFTNYQGAIQFGTALDADSDSHEQAALKKYNAAVQGNQANWREAPYLMLKEITK